MTTSEAAPTLTVGWGQADITPPEPVLVAGQFHARVSEGVADPITATVLVLATADDQAVFVSCDLVGVSFELRDAVRQQVQAEAPELEATKVMFNATHTHTAPETRIPQSGAGHTSGASGIELPVMPIADYVGFAAQRIAAAVLQAWGSRAPGGVAYGLGHAVVGLNRRWVDEAGVACMYGNLNTPDFSHIEGYVDHSLNLLATYDEAGGLSGLVVNVPCPSQVSESEYVLSADYWCETRAELRRRLGAELPVLAQCSAAGDQSPHPLYEKRAAARMLELSGNSERHEIACRIADAAERTLAVIGKTIDRAPTLRHHAETMALPLLLLNEEQASTARAEAAKLRAEYEAELRRLEADPELKQQPRWYRDVTRTHRRSRWFEGVAERFERQQTEPTMPAEVHVVRLGDIAFASNPFEYYLDFGVYIKARSPALQTFLIQLTGPGTYVPSQRSFDGGGYGSMPASNPVGPEGGRQLAARTVELIHEAWE